jgi:hypothetical protein
MPRSFELNDGPRIHALQPGDEVGDQASADSANEADMGPNVTEALVEREQKFRMLLEEGVEIGLPDILGV